MAKAKKPKYLFDGIHGKHYVRQWNTKDETVIQVWLNKAKPDGQPDGDWGYPKFFGKAAIDQGIMDTETEAERSKK